MDIVELLRAFFSLAACTILVVNSSSLLRNRLVAYGARSTSSGSDSNERTHSVPSDASKVSWIKCCLDYVSSWKVPHSYFTQFYAMSLLSSILWGIQLVLRGRLFRVVSSAVDDSHLEKSMSFNQIVLCWALLACQGVRRLHECITLAKPSDSKMWFVHWILGLVYYIAMGISIWIEGTGALLSTDNPFGDASISAPSLKTTICLPMFFMASGIQRDCHYYLASLKKYTLPVHPAFLSVVCPHYTAECAIYLSLAFLAAPEGELVNKTLLSGLVFVAVNLGVSAVISKEWYAKKFGKENVQHKWKMFPYVY